MKNKMALILITVIILVGAVFAFGAPGKAQLTENLLGSKEKIQVVKLSVEGGRYVLSPSEIKKGEIVRLEADLSMMPGCSKSIVIPSFNVRKSFTGQDNAVEFIADKAGTFNIMCSMNMYKGSFTVLEDDGTRASYIEQTPAASTGGSCGMAVKGSGGCGCGG